MRSLSCAVFLIACGASTATPDTSQVTTTTRAIVGPSGARVFAVSTMGMHCVDNDYAVLSLFPPYNVLEAQVVAVGAKPALLGAGDVTLHYASREDATGSRNGSSAAKTNFWRFALKLYGRTLGDGEGLAGLFMPDDAASPDARAFRWSEARQVFAADGIPAFPRDDDGNTRHYPLLHVEATNTAGTPVGFVDAVLPVSDETACASCHDTGAGAARSPDIAWASDADAETAARKNVLILHDARHQTQLVAQQPVACASCHDSPAIDAAVGWTSVANNGLSSMSRVMHGFHADKMRDANGVAFKDLPTAPGASPADPSTLTCYQCHPGARTRCLRGAMADVMVCQNCHGGMDGVAAAARRPWLDLPRCSGCHTGDAVTALDENRPVSPDGVRMFQAFASNDAAAVPLSSPSGRFAENPELLFRDSRGHGGVACKSCHGSPHALWSAKGGEVNDRVAPTQLQGYAGVISECTTCHATAPIGLGGPHGMHPVDSQDWVDNHPTFYHQSRKSCAACHGGDMRGTVLSTAARDRDFEVHGVSVHIAAGTQVSCVQCHALPSPVGPPFH